MKNFLCRPAILGPEEVQPRGVIVAARQSQLSLADTGAESRWQATGGALVLKVKPRNANASMLNVANGSSALLHCRERIQIEIEIQIQPNGSESELRKEEGLGLGLSLSVDPSDSNHKPGRLVLSLGFQICACFPIPSHHLCY